MSVAIWWIRRDLRLTDNPALTAALASAEQIVPVFVLDPALLNSAYTSQQRTAFLFGGLRALSNEIAARGGHLIVRQGEPATQLAALCRECTASAIYAERDYSPYATARDERVARATSVPLHLTEGLTIRPLVHSRKDDGTPYTVYTPYSRRWRSHDPIRRGEILQAPRQFVGPAALASVQLPDQPGLSAHSPFPPGEAEARHRLNRFVSGDCAPIFGYANTRNRPDIDGVSSLSPYLRFGMISARSAAVAAYAAIETAADAESRRSADTWLNELIWRDFYIAILHHFPHVRRGSFRPEYDDICWENDEQRFAAWCAGQTGYPFVDAAMRQLARNRLDAQPRAHDRRIVSRQGPAHRLALGRTLVHAAAGRWRSGGQQRRLAVDGRHRHRRRALLPHLQSDPAGREVRPRRRLRPPVGAGIAQCPDPVPPRAVDDAQQRASARAASSARITPRRSSITPSRGFAYSKPTKR